MGRSKLMTSRVVHFLRLHRLPILRQLQLEETLLRGDHRNWCLVNSAIDTPTAVLGISAKIEDVLDIQKARKQGIHVLRRFSGGGTVIIDQHTLLVTFIFKTASLPDVPPYPRPIMKWTEQLYRPVFAPLGDFRLRDNDYTFGDLKFGGNAQSIIKDRWLHHTSFLWDYDPTLMATLKSPLRQPIYRQNRSHEAFLCTLKHHFESKSDFFGTLQKALVQQGFDLQMSHQGIDDFPKIPLIRTTKVLPLDPPELDL